MLKVDDFIKRLKHIEANRVTMYSNVFPYNCGFIGHQYLSFDCIGLVKSLINNPEIAYKTEPLGYYVKPAQVIPDTTEIGILDLCTDVSRSFVNIPIGSYLYMSGHAGVFVGEFTDPSGVVNTIECTPAFGGGVVTSYTDTNGVRWNHKGGYTSGRWEAHGKLSKYIEYKTEEKPKPKKQISVDGEWGIETTKATQEFLSTEIDGVVSNQNGGLQVYCPACVPRFMQGGSWEWNYTSGYSPMVHALQKWLCMPTSEWDGQFGQKTIKQLQTYLGVNADGYCGRITVTAWQKYLNKWYER